MARKKTPSVLVDVDRLLADRLREIREELFGERGGPELARRLNLPARTWYNYETGVTVPAEVLLRFIQETGANPMYLLTGEGARYTTSVGEPATSLSVEELLRNALERLEKSGRESTGPAPEDHVSLRIFPLKSLAERNPDRSASRGVVWARREWVPNLSETVAVSVPDGAMFPVLPEGSIAVVDRSVTDPAELQGQVVAARTDDGPVLRWLEVSGRHLILRPNQPGRDFPTVPFPIDQGLPSPVLGKVVCSWSRFGSPSG